MKLSETSLQSVKRALKIDFSHDDELITEIMDIAKDRLIQLTNRELDDLDNYPCVVHAFNCVCSDFYDGTDEHEKTIQAICHSIQLNMVV